MLSSFVFSYGQQINHSVGIKFSISLSSPKKTSGGSIAITYGIYRTPKEKSSFKFIPAYQLSINSYLNGIGTSFKKNEISFDFHNSILLTAYTNKLKIGSIDIASQFHFIDHTYIRNINVIPLQSASSFSISSNFILNLKKRNQLYGSILGQIGKFRIQHYNDGGIIMGNLKIGDDKDRWWTGGTFIELGNDIHFDSIPKIQRLPNKIRISFHRFTWDNQEEFEQASLIGLEYIPIKKENQEDALYNFGKYSFSINWNHYEVNIEANNKFKDLQDILHQIGKLAKHPTISPKYYSVEVSRNLRYLVN